MFTMEGGFSLETPQQKRGKLALRRKSPDFLELWRVSSRVPMGTSETHSWAVCGVQSPR